MMTIRTCATDVGFLLGGSRPVCASNIVLLLGLGLDLTCVLAFRTFGSSAESDSTEDDAVYVISTELIVHEDCMIMMVLFVVSDSHVYVIDFER